ncbi:ferrochelatase [Gilliamella sp. Fer1-1]|jgi:protoporphyrin/coproporphyrin ferrochelatase|uniref:ferrochelatase n=1 Tax=unclassified Gilliamella TaxID=2685620 RepID=UPI00080E4298|nr:ferrochelatase [Gilliamella apicola]OCG19398.1 ferrochelatase [Gilliamella apicola]OCG26440.1 ferrochelatase [Gilliamella apicola]OCG30688.1 ferrochelatase [Gilliamella apicola]OCG34335.1 ferrochelatase [Gilliamella apicola]OCG44114.1 ferrochelatase [Gilliamella apicola]
MDKKQGLLLVNLGTPNAATPDAIKQYLTEFLLDRHVVDLPKLLWYPILKYRVIPKRVPYIINHYQKIWINNASPLLHYSRLLCDKLQHHLPNIQCELAMTYGDPNLQSALNNLRSCTKITVLPLFPQYSTTTTLAVLDKIKQIITSLNIIDHIDYIRDYADHRSYINALYLQIKQAFHHQGEPDVLVLSYHGIPERYIHNRNDDYIQRCEMTTQLLVKKCRENGINIPIQMAYQSKFGKGKWVTPSTSSTLQILAQRGVKNVQVICPGFSVDCIETIYEIDEENREVFLNAGGKNFYYIPALNDTHLQINLIIDLINYIQPVKLKN